MKRPFVYMGVLFLLFMVMLYKAGSRENGSPYHTAVALMEEEAAKSKTISVYGILSECNAVSAGLRLSVGHLTIQKRETSDISLPSDLKLSITIEDAERDMDILPGDTVFAQGKFRAYDRATNPGQFDAQAYYSAQNILGTLKCTDFSVSRSAGNGAARAAGRLRRMMRESYERILEERTARTVSAIILGEKGWMEREWKDLYQEGGISHILAISGLHISLVGMSLYRLLRRLGLRFGAAAVLSGSVLIFYVIMAGTGVSAVRAMVMFFVWLGAQVCGRKYDMITGLAAAAAFLVGADVRNLFQASFLLSFSAILSLAVLVPSITESCRIRTAAGKSMAASAAVWLGTLPCALYFFFQVSPWSILVNLAVVPLMAVLMSFGLAAAVAGLISLQAGIFLASPVYYLLACFEWLCTLEQKLPMPVWVAGRPGPVCIILYYGVILAVICMLRRKKRKWPALPIWVCCGAVCIFLMGFHPRADLQVDCLDVGQGDCALLRLPSGENCLIDGGSTSESSIWEYTVEPAVKYYGIRMIDYIFLSHADQDHINGITEYLEAYSCGFNGKNVHGVSVRNIVLPVCQDEDDFTELKNLADKNKITVWRMEAGDCIVGKSWELCCVAPSSDTLTGDRNEDSMVLMLSCGQFQMLFTGDLEGEAEKRLALSGMDLQADVLKAGHHGSAGASSREFLEQVSPKLAVISCGKDNVYGHPAGETLQRLEEAGSDILVTAACGAVRITTDGKAFTVETIVDTG